MKMSLQETQNLIEKLIQQEQFLDNFVRVLQQAKEHGNRIHIAGNGGSASIASHFTSDLKNLGFDVVCLNDNISRLTALANDYCWEVVYEKQLLHLRPYDILILISVHGGSEKSSQNLVLAAIEARKRAGKILSLLGDVGGELKKFSDYYIIVPSNSCCYVEGLYSVLTHIICERLRERGS